MPEITPRQLALCVGGAVLAIALGIAQLERTTGATAAAPRPPAPIAVRDDDGGRVVVHVAGAVRNPGVYRLHTGARVSDAVERAGGAKAGADLGGLNLAAKLEDGRQVLVPTRAAQTGTGAPGTASQAGAGAQAPPLNINTATLEQLDTLSGVGPATAQKILEYRQEKGGFGSIEELGEIPGIGEKRMASLREEVTL
jgi:competence protein ComEA